MKKELEEVCEYVDENYFGIRLNDPWICRTDSIIDRYSEEKEKMRISYPDGHPMKPKVDCAVNHSPKNVFFFKMMEEQLVARKSLKLKRKKRG